MSHVDDIQKKKTSYELSNLHELRTNKNINVTEENSNRNSMSSLKVAAVYYTVMCLSTGLMFKNIYY